MRVAILFGVLLVGLLGLTSLATAADHTKDTLDAVKKAMADGKAVLLDVREKSEWDDGHLKDAKLLPLSVLTAGPKVEDVAKIVPKDKIVYCHCRSGVRSLKAADELKKLGYDVRPLKPGYTDLLKAGFQKAEEPSADSKEPEFEVRWSGELKNVMMKGDLKGTIDLKSITKLPHMYAVGALEGLQGEVTILDSIPSIARVKEGKAVTDKVTEGKACVLVYAQVKLWKEVPLPKTIQSLDQLDSFVVEAANKQGINVARPFPFVVKGMVNEAQYHVLRHPGDIKDPHELHDKAKLKYTLKDTEVDLIGFYSDQHLGIFTCGGNLHVHLRSGDGKISGHLDEVNLGDEMRLCLPIPSPK